MSTDETTDLRFPVHLLCPHCHNPIEIVVDNREEEVICPSCGSSIRLDSDRTQSWNKDKLPTLGKFELIEAVGRGAFGTVYKALDTQLQRMVAIKVPRSGQLATDEDGDRFVREARNAAQLQHAGIVPVYEVGRSETFPYIVSEFVEGITLADALTARKFSFRESAQLVAQVAEALQHAHDQGVVHRDLKPSNIMLTPDGSPRVMDFGLAKRDAGEITMTVEGHILGTPTYMSPEQASGQAHRADGRSDVYSLGVLLYELLTGELPFRGNQRMLLHQVLHDEPRAPRSLNDRISRDLETICLKAMAKEPARRYQSAQAMAEELTRHLAGIPIMARPVGRVERGWRWCRRNPVVASLAACIVLALAAISLVSTSAAFFINGARRDEAIQREHASAARQEALNGFKQARDKVDTWLTGTSEILKYYPDMQQVRKQLLHQAAVDYEQFTKRHNNDIGLEIERGRAHIRLGDVHRLLGDASSSEQAYREGERLFAGLLAQGQEVTDSQVEQANARVKRALLSADTGHLQEAEQEYETAISDLKASAASPSASQRVHEALGTALTNHAALQRDRGDFDQAISTLGQSLNEFAMGWTSNAEGMSDNCRLIPDLDTF